MSPRSHASQMPPSRNGIEELQRAASALSPGKSVGRNLDPEATPRAQSPVGDLDPEEEKLDQMLLLGEKSTYKQRSERLAPRDLYLVPQTQRKIWIFL